MFVAVCEGVCVLPGIYLYPLLLPANLLSELFIFILTVEDEWKHDAVRIVGPRVGGM